METETLNNHTNNFEHKAPTSMTRNLENALSYLEEILRIALENNLKKNNTHIEYPLFEFEDNGEPFFEFTMSYELSFEEFIVVLLALAPHLRPNLLDAVIEKYLKKDDNFPEIGGRKTADIRYMMPTGDTALFILAGYNLEKRLEVQTLFDEHSFLASEAIVKLEEVKSSEPKMSGKLVIDNELIDFFTKGFVELPKFSSSFPAQHISTDLKWNDLILCDDVKSQITEIKEWIDHNNVLMDKWNMKQKVKPGYLALLHGAPGTGKTLTATLLGKYTERHVFRVDLSTIISKYIGETEKNLGNLFDKAEHKNWILAFEEADALFGKRTNVSSAHDRFANQEVSYLLQRIETFSGLIILTTNFKGNIDDAFLRRFNAIVEFPFPSFEERIRIWEKSFPKTVTFENSENIPKLAARYELAGGNIINAVQYACLKAISRNSTEIRYSDIVLGVKREFEKSGKMFQEIE